MKLIRLIKPSVLGLVLAVAAAGCHKTNTPVTPLPPPGTSGNPKDPGPGGALDGGGKINQEDIAKGIKSNEATNHQGWAEDPDMFKSDTVHFDYDSSVIKAGDKPKVAAVADYLKGNSSSAVRIEGHCDERGTDEYNRALGERRALAIREELARLGIDPSRVDTISYGRDRRIDKGSTEAAHRKNRRGEFVLLTQPK